MAANHDDEIVHRELDTDVENPAVAVAEVVAELKETEAGDLSTTYDRVDGVLDNMFSTPPASEAQMTVTFTYEDFRVTVEQNGAARFVQVG